MRIANFNLAFYDFRCFNFYYRPQEVIHQPRIPTKNEYQRFLHESYQFIIKLIVEQQRIEEERRTGEQEDKKKEAEDLFKNVKKIRMIRMNSDTNDEYEKINERYDDEGKKEKKEGRRNSFIILKKE